MQIKAAKNCGLHSSPFDTQHGNVDLVLSALICENLSSNCKNSPLIQTQMRQLSGHGSIKSLYLFICIFIQIDAAKEWRVALISV